MRATKQAVLSLCTVSAVLVAVDVTPRASAAPAHTVTWTVESDRPASMPVVLHRPLRLAVDEGFDSPNVSISGKGRILGLALRRAGSSAEPALVAAVMQDCFAAGCTSTKRYRFVNGARAKSAAGFVIVPPGHYTLQVFTDGAPVRATLRLEGTGPDQVFRPHGKANYEVQSPRGTLDAVPAPVRGLNASTTRYQVRRPGILSLAFGRVQFVANGGGNLAACYYDGDVPAVLPGCAGGTGISFAGAVVSPAPGSQIVYGSYADPASGGPVTAGLAVAEASLIENVGANIAWLES